MQETDWVDISADLANVDDDTPDNSQGIDDDEAMLEDLQLTNDDDDDDDNSDGDDNVMKFDDGNNIELMCNKSLTFFLHSLQILSHQTMKISLKTAIP